MTDRTNELLADIATAIREHTAACSGAPDMAPLLEAVGAQMQQMGEQMDENGARRQEERDLLEDRRLAERDSDYRAWVEAQMSVSENRADARIRAFDERLARVEKRTPEGEA